MDGRGGPRAQWPVQPDAAARAVSGVLPTPRGHAEDEAPGASQLRLPLGALRGTRGAVVLKMYEEDLALEGSIASPPKAHSHGCISPANLDLHRLQLDRRVAAVQERVAQEAEVPLAQGRLALLGLALVAAVRALSWWEGTQPGYSSRCLRQ
ncbi:unnamed protein product [Prorocentrum cordatum]|uniref:Uncharacterized protein n=1 Tax=Prorocentrum cordatum TaxID=2364126 RepID=A0ABN9RKV1_9DINO|nr:unnamed protein product [Polarella glacialis]